jgi:YHS domain-containing protein
MKTQSITILGAMLLAAAALTFMGCKKDEPDTYKAKDAQAMHEMHAAHGAAERLDAEILPPGGETAVTLRPVAADRVCMVNDQVFSDPQIPVVVDGKTYYGCCPACEAMLERERTMRVAIDPVTGKEVDKATAAIGAFPDGRVLYFASVENRDAFDPATMR